MPEPERADFFAATYQMAYRAGYVQGQKDLWRKLYDLLVTLWPDLSHE